MWYLIGTCREVSKQLPAQSEEMDIDIMLHQKHLFHGIGLHFCEIQKIRRNFLIFWQKILSALEEGKQMYCTHEDTVLTQPNNLDVSALSPCTIEVDTRMF